MASEESRNNKRARIDDAALAILEENEEGEIRKSNEEEMALLLGFESFGSTKNTQVEDNSKTAARGGRAPRHFRQARQYMNKKKAGGKKEGYEGGGDKEKKRGNHNNKEE